MVDGPNLYRYSRNNPLIFNDPDGRNPPNPALYASFDDFAAAAEAPYSRDYLQNLWDTHYGPITPTMSRTVSHATARSEADAAARAYRVDNNMVGQGPSVQAAHTIAARHVNESGIARDVANAPESFMQLNSRRGQGLEVTVGNSNPTTVHRAQEQIINDAVDKVRAANDGALEPRGHAMSGAEVRWRLEGAGFDQRELDAKRASGLFDETAAIESSPSVQSRRAAIADAAAAAETTPTRVAPESPMATPAADAAAPEISTASTSLTSESKALISTEKSVVKRIGVSGAIGGVLTGLNVYFAIDAYKQGAAKHGTGGGVLDAAVSLQSGSAGFTDMLEAAPLLPRIWDAIKAGIGPNSPGFGAAIAFGRR